MKKITSILFILIQFIIQIFSPIFQPEFHPDLEPPISEEYPIVYSDESCEINITKEWYGNQEGAYCYIAHITFSDYSRLSTSCALNQYGGYETTSDAAARLGSILTVNGPHSTPDEETPVVCNKTVFRDGKCNVPAVYSSYTGKLFNPQKALISDKTISDLVNSKTITDSFCFINKPYLIDNVTYKYGGDTSRAQRTFIGTNESPGDIWVVVSEGRYSDGKSAGLTYLECAELLKSKGCSFGIPLDGGGSSTMVFKGKILNCVANERPVVDFLYFK